jgi:hypothetical protein
MLPTWPSFGGLETDLVADQVGQLLQGAAVLLQDMTMLYQDGFNSRETLFDAGDGRSSFGLEPGNPCVGFRHASQERRLVLSHSRLNLNQRCVRLNQRCLSMSERSHRVIQPPISIASRPRHAGSSNEPCSRFYPAQQRRQFTAIRKPMVNYFV